MQELRDNSTDWHQSRTRTWTRRIHFVRVNVRWSAKNDGWFWTGWTAGKLQMGRSEFYTEIEDAKAAAEEWAERYLLAYG